MLQTEQLERSKTTIGGISCGAERGWQSNQYIRRRQESYTKKVLSLARARSERTRDRAIIVLDRQTRGVLHPDCMCHLDKPNDHQDIPCYCDQVFNKKEVILWILATRTGMWSASAYGTSLHVTCRDREPLLWLTCNQPEGVDEADDLPCQAVGCHGSRSQILTTVQQILNTCFIFVSVYKYICGACCFGKREVPQEVCTSQLLLVPWSRSRG